MPLSIFQLKSQELMHKKTNYMLVRTLLDSLQRDLRWIINPPDGSKQHPATTCLELWLAHPSSTNGESDILLV